MTDKIKIDLKKQDSDKAKVFHDYPEPTFTVGDGRVEENKKIQATPVPKYTRQDILQTLKEEGMIVTSVALSDDQITDESIINAQHNCIVKLREDQKSRNESIVDMHNKLNEFYLAAQRAGVTISRNDKNQIVMATPPMPG